MRDLLADFECRVEEVEEYFDFLLEVVGIETFKQDSIVFPNGKRYTVTSDLQKVLKSNCFLMLYNLVEASIREGIVAIYDAIHDDGLVYLDVNAKIRKVWLYHRCENLTDPRVTKVTVMKTVQCLLDDTTRGSCVTLDRSKIRTSGNLDMEAINSLVEEYGFYGKINNNDERLQYIMSTVRKMRNDIAHGNVTFRSASKNITSRELVEYQSRTVSYLRDILNNINDFIINRRYT